MAVVQHLETGRRLSGLHARCEFWRHRQYGYKIGGGVCYFGGISLANVDNTNFVGGISGSETVALARQSGLQAFTFNLPLVTSVAIATDPGNPSNSHILRFDDLVVNAVPLPASAPMFGAALLALGTAGYGLKRKKAASAA